MRWVFSNKFPHSDCGIAGGTEDEVWLWESDTTDLHTRFLGQLIAGADIRAMTYIILVFF